MNSRSLTNGHSTIDALGARCSRMLASAVRHFVVAQVAAVDITCWIGVKQTPAAGDRETP